MTLTPAQPPSSPAGAPAGALDTLVIVTYDEFGGAWDHVPPPTGAGVSDMWGPGTRIPALVVSAQLNKSGVDHTEYDTTSILATIEKRFVARSSITCPAAAPLRAALAVVEAAGRAWVR